MKKQNSLYHVNETFKALEDLTELDITDGFKWKDEISGWFNNKNNNNNKINNNNSNNNLTRSKKSKRYN